MTAILIIHKEGLIEECTLKSHLYVASTIFMGLIVTVGSLPFEKNTIYPITATTTAAKIERIIKSIIYIYIDKLKNLFIILYLIINKGLSIFIR